LSERTSAAEEKRRLILDAAVRVFARKGFHASRVGDIAEEAGVAHGLLYHYFDSKDEVLEAIFHERWGDLVSELAAIEASDESPREQLLHVVARMLEGWQRHPEVVTVLVREFARSPEIQARIGELVKPIETIQRIIAHGQRSGDFRDDVDARLAGIVLYGGIEELLSGWVLGQLPAGPDVSAAALATIEALVVGSLDRVGAAVS
jgi:TetR/AcrR family transcriptional regulator, fatty acid metabolism regulator protein